MIQLLLVGYMLTILKLLHMYIKPEQLSKWMVDGESQVSHCWSGRLQTRKKARMIYVVPLET